MIFDKYRKTYQMYQENKERVENTDIKKTEINRISRNTLKINKISKLFNGPFIKRTYNNFKKEK